MSRNPDLTFFIHTLCVALQILKLACPFTISTVLLRSCVIPHSSNQKSVDEKTKGGNVFNSADDNRNGQHDNKSIIPKP